MNVTSKREHFKRKDRLPVAAFFRGDLFVFGDMKLMEPTKLVPGLRLKTGWIPNFFTKKKKRMEQKDGELHMALQPGCCLNPPKKNMLEWYPNSHPFGARTMLRFVVSPGTLTKICSNKNKISQTCPNGCFFKKGYPQKGYSI